MLILKATVKSKIIGVVVCAGMSPHKLVYLNAWNLGSGTMMALLV